MPAGFSDLPASSEAVWQQAEPVPGLPKESDIWILTRSYTPFLAKQKSLQSAGIQ